MKKYLILLFTCLSTWTYGQLFCSFLIEDSVATICSGQIVTITANAPLAGMGNGGSCNYLPASLQPLAWYPFCGNNLDESGHGNHGSGSHDIYGPDRFGRVDAALYAGYVFVLDNVYLDFWDAPFTLSAWVRTINSQEDQYIFRKGSSSSVSDVGLLLKYDSIQNITYPQFYTKGAHEMPGGSYDTVYWQTSPNAVNIADSNWHFITAVREGPNLRIFVDGSLVSDEQFAGANGVILNNNVFAVIGGKELSLSNTIWGELDDVSVFYGAFDSLQINDLYSIIAIDYAWSTGETSNAIQFSSGTDTLVTVTADNGTDICTDTINIYISGNTIAEADSIYGQSLECIPRKGGSKIFTVDSIPGAIAYHWMTPPGLIIESGQGSPTLKVKWRTSSAYYGIAGDLCVVIETACGFGDTTCIPVDLQITSPGTPPFIYADHIYKMCPGDTSGFYIVPVTRATSYKWVMPAGLQIIGVHDSNHVTVIADSTFSGGNLAVRSENVCNSSSYRTKFIDFNTPIKPAIGGPADDLCHRQLGNGELYYTISNKNAFSKNTAFNWTMPSWMEIDNPIGVPSPDILASFIHTSNTLIGHITVIATNTCGTSPVGKKAVRNTPFYIEPITGPIFLCETDTVTYTFSDPPWHAIQQPRYEWGWDLPTYFYDIHDYIVSGDSTNTILMNWPAMLPPGQVLKVREISDDCGVSPWRKLENIIVANCSARLSNSNKQVEIYPNPVTDFLNIRIESARAGKTVIKIFDMTGRDIMSFRQQFKEGLNTFEVDCNALSEGTYILRLTNEEGLVRHLKFNKRM